MKHLLKKTLLAAAILSLLVISQVVSAAPITSPVVYDNFDDNVTNPARWTVGQAGGPTAVEAGQRLEITFPADSSGEKFDAAYYST